MKVAEFLRPVFAVFVCVAISVAVNSSPAIAADVVDYEIEVVLDPDTHRLQGVERIHWTNTTAVATSEIYFHLYLNAFASSETTFMREFVGSSLRGWTSNRGDWGWIRIDGMIFDDGSDLLPKIEFVRPDDGNLDDFSAARVELPREVRPGDAIEIAISFEAQLPWIVARTGFVGDFHLVGQWFPKIAVFEGEEGWNCHQFHASSEFFADFGAYRVEMTIPDGWVLGATGVEIENEPTGDGGRKVVYRARRVHDFAWCAAPAELMEVVEADFDPGRDVPMAWLERAQSLLGLSAAELELPPTRLTLIVPRSQRAMAPRMVRAARLAIAWFGLRFGAFPYPRLTIVSPPEGAEEAGGMEYPTFITTGVDRLDADPPFSWSSRIEEVTIHEFGHQYFQGLLASNEFERGWLDEGVTTYAEISCMTDIASDGVVPEIWPYPYWGSERLRIAFSEVPVTIARKAWDYRRRWHYYLASYSKMGIALRTVEGLIGAEAMARGLRTYVERFAYRHPTGRDLALVLGEAAERDLGWFFDQAVYGDAQPDWAVLSVRHRRPRPAEGLAWDGNSWRGDGGSAAKDVDTDNGEWLVEVELARKGGFIGPVEVELTWADGASERRVWEGHGRWVRWQMHGSRRLEQVVVDPDGVWALETRRADNYWRDHPVRTDHPLWWVREVLGVAGRIFLRWG
jgi:hypothetical protein